MTVRVRRISHSPVCWLYLLSLLHVALSYRVIRSLRSQLKAPTNPLLSSPLYDPFESDPILKESILKELETIRSLDTKVIRAELKDLGVSSKSIVDRTDLEAVLSKARIRARLRTIAAQDAETRARVERSNRIADEIEKIKTSGMTDRTIIDELHSLFARVDVNGNLVQQLALARLGLNGAPQNTSATAPLPEPIIGVVEEFKDTYSRFRSGVEDVGTQTTAEIGKIVSEISSSKEVQKVSNFTSNIGLTNAEQIAKGIISSSSSEYDDLDSPFPGDLSGRDDRARDVSQLTREDLEAIMLEAENHQTFDDILHWAIHRPRSLIAKLLQMRGETVPKYAPRSALAGILADSITAQREADELATTDGDDVSGGASTGTEDGDAPRAGGTRKKPSKKPRQKKPLSVSYTGPQSTIGSRSRRRGAASNLNAYSFEKDIFNRFTEKFRETVDHFIDGDDLIPNMPHMPNLADIPNVTFMTSIKLLTFSAYSVMHGFIVSLAKWAGGKLLPSPYVVFGVCAYNIAFRKGLLSFFASFVVLRATRALFAVFGALTGADAANGSEEEEGELESTMS